MCLFAFRFLFDAELLKPKKEELSVLNAADYDFLLAKESDEPPPDEEKKKEDRDKGGKDPNLRHR